MLGSVATRERRGFWGTASFLLVIGIGASLYFAQAARGSATDEAARLARLTAQTQLAPLLTDSDLQAPITGERYDELAAAIERDITTAGPVEQVTIWSSVARNLYDVDPALVGARSSYLQQLTFEVANGEPRTDVVDGMLRTFVPLWLQPGGTVVVAEMDQAFGPIAAQANAPWYRLALGLAIGLAIALSIYALTFLSSTRGASRETAYVPSRPSERPRDLNPPDGSSPAYTQAGFRQLEEARQTAEARAAAAEENYRGLQADFKTMLENLKILETNLASYESSATKAEREVETLRAQVRDSAERIGTLEDDGNAMRERLKLRERELGTAQAQLDEAEAKAKQAERELERTLIELQTLESRFHMSKLSEALRDLDEVIVPDADGATAGPPPRVIYTVSSEDEDVLPAAGKAR